VRSAFVSVVLTFQVVAPVCYASDETMARVSSIRVNRDRSRALCEETPGFLPGFDARNGEENDFPNGSDQSFRAT
jgi:hypothetical protein